MNLAPIAIALLIAAAALPAPALAKSDSQLWTVGSASVKLSDKWRLSQEFTGRFSDNRNGLYEVESNTLLGYRLNEVVTLWAGYTHDPQYSGGDFTVMEHRAREQVTFDGLARLGKGKLNGRIRLEQRWREGVDGTGWRFRPYLKYSLPIAGKTALNLSTEPFFNLNTTPFQRKSGLDRVRNLVTISTPLAKKLSGEAGYLNQHGFVPNGPDTSDNVAYVGVSLSL
ncbi:MAG TPA: DUF2490 domain-containing protein [Sphingomicrobium sp.]|nr:DUF2490 domain-containing protein [Sphingomicrobium sp.]